MIMIKSEERVTEVLSLLPEGMRDEVIRICRQRIGGISGIREIRVRACARSSALIGREWVSLFSTASEEEMGRLVKKLCDGALYAHRDSIASGYLTLRGGVRVGICGHARYEDGSLVGVSDVRSLVFRIPGHRCEFSDELEQIFRSGIGRGMLIYSSPGVGKTTALRALALRLGSGRDAVRVAVIDERCEFDERDYRDSEVDILKGYERRRGIEIATRTMSPEVIMIDELCAEDALLLPSVLRSGVPVVATAHAGSYAEVKEKPSLSPFISSGAFEVFVGLRLDGGEYSLTLDRI